MTEDTLTLHDDEPLLLEGLAVRIAGRERGFTLVEVTVSVALLAVLFLSLFASLLNSMWLSASSSEDAIALEYGLRSFTGDGGVVTHV